MIGSAALGVCGEGWPVGVAAAVLWGVLVPRGGLAVPPAGEKGRDGGAGERIEGSIRIGAEYDENPRRTEADRSGGDVLGRYFAELRWEPPTAGEDEFRLEVRQGGKIFGRARGSDVLLSELAAEWSRSLGDHWTPLVTVRFKDRLERRSRQDYSRGRASAGVRARAGPVRVGLRGGWRYFAFRPTPSASSHGPWGRLRLSVDLGGGVSVWTRYSSGRFLYPGARFVEGSDGGGPEVTRDPGGESRRDTRHGIGAGATYRGPIVARLRYEFSRNLSNSYGRELTRHQGTAEATVPIPWRLYLSARVRLQKTRYEEPVSVDARFSVDEQDRNSGVASLTRAIGEHWEVELRYRLFIEEFGSGSLYRRQTGYFGAAYYF